MTATVTKGDDRLTALLITSVSVWVEVLLWKLRSNRQLSFASLRSRSQLSATTILNPAEDGSFSSGQTQVLTDAETLGKLRQNPPANWHQGRWERAKQPLSQGFFPTYSLYTTSKRFALWNRLYEIWANLRAACWISKMKTNREAGKRRVGVSAGVYYNLAVGRSWDEDAELTRFSWDAVTSVPSTCDYRWKLLDIFGCQPPFFPVFFFFTRRQTDLNEPFNKLEHKFV